MMKAIKISDKQLRNIISEAIQGRRAGEKEPFVMKEASVADISPDKAKVLLLQIVDLMSQGDMLSSNDITAQLRDMLAEVGFDLSFKDLDADDAGYNDDADDVDLPPMHPRGRS